MRYLPFVRTRERNSYRSSTFTSISQRFVIKPVTPFSQTPWDFVLILFADDKRANPLKPLTVKRYYQPIKQAPFGKVTFRILKGFQAYPMAKAFVTSFPCLHEKRSAFWGETIEGCKQNISKGFSTSFTEPSHRRRRKYFSPTCLRESWLPPSVATVTDNSTGSKIYIVGCVHGSNFSANDVCQVLDRTDPDAIVLELCEPRLKALRKTIAKKDEGSQYAANIGARTKKSFAQLSKSFGGRGPAIVALVLEKVYEFQTLVGIDPGIEFVEPIVRFPPNRIICGDVLARDTVNALFRVFAAPFRSLNDCFSSVVDIFNRVMFPPQGGVQMLLVFLRSPGRLLELLRLIFPASLVAILIGLVGNAGAFAFDMTPIGASVSHPVFAASLASLSSLVDSLLLAYVSVSLLRFTKVLIADRDKVLSESVLNTLSSFRKGQGAPVTVCVVVGLLHVNGILRILQKRIESV